MPAVSQAEGEPPDTVPDTPGSGHSPGAAVLAAERSYLRESRGFRQLMREDVLSLKALGGDPVSRGWPPCCAAPSGRIWPSRPTR